MLKMKRRRRKKAEAAPRSSQSAWMYLGRSLTLAGFFFITERNGGIVSIAEGKKERMQLQLKKPVHQEGEGGLLGFVLHPDFKNNQEAYVYHTYKDGSHLKTGS